MDPAMLEALQQKAAGEKRKAPAEAAAGAVSAPATIEGVDANASVLNASNADALKAVLGLEASPVVLKSDADEQLLVSMTLSQTFKLHAIKVAGPDDGSAPSVIKLFANKQAMTFDDTEDYQATQILSLTSASATLPLQQTKFTAVSSLTIFIEGNQGDHESTGLSRIELVGVPVHTTDMKDLKKGG